MQQSAWSWAMASLNNTSILSADLHPEYNSSQFLTSSNSSSSFSSIQEDHQFVKHPGSPQTQTQTHQHHHHHHHHNHNHTLNETSISASGFISSTKKRKLSEDQASGLEKSFVEKRALDSSKKARLARELGLEERQVAIWYQNRRARSKAKQLEMDFTALRASYEALQGQRSLLRTQIANLAKQLKEKINEGYNHQYNLKTISPTNSDVGERYSKSSSAKKT